MSAGYGLALPSLGACGIDPYTMHQGQQPSTPSLASAAVSSGSCGSTGSSSSLPALQPGYPPLSALVEAQQPHAGALQGPHYYFGHRHFNYSAPNLVMTNHGHHRHQSGSPTYDLEWTTPSPSHIRTPAAAISTSPAHSPPLSAAEAATPGSGGATATSPYSSSLGSWDASSASASADSPAVSPVLFYHHHHHPPPDAAMAAAAVAVAAAGQYHPHYHHYSHHHHDDHQFQQQQAMPAQSSLYYDLPAPTANTDYHPQQQLQSASEEQAAHAPSLEAMSRGRRGRKRRCDEAIMALHPSALLAVKEEEAEAESADELYHHHRRHNQQQDQLQRQLDGSSSELASRRAGSHEWPFVASEESTMPADQLNSGSSEVDDDDFFSDDDDDEETNDDDNECDSDRDGGEDSDDVDDDDDDDDDDAYAGTRAAKRSKRSAQQQQQQQQTTTMKKKKRRRKQVVKVERRVERRVEVTADLNIEAHLSPESDGYRWRKYGRKTVKGSPYPRSYFKCTFSHCPVKKQVEAVIRDGHIVSTSSIYKGKHNHDRPCVTQLTAHDQDSFRNAVLAGFADYDAAHAAREGTAEGGGGARSSAGNNTPRLVVTTEASVDYLDDGYRWRKYGQKYVKGSGYPRSYYKCTDKQCPVKKQVDALLVGLVVTYEGAHTHAPCLDKSAPRKRRRRNPAAPAATTTRRSRAGGEAASTPVKFEPASSPEADELPLHPSSSSSPSADHSSPVAKQERRRSSHLASFRHSAHPVTYHPYHHPQQPPPPQYQQPQHYHQSYHHHQQQQHQQQHEYESNDHCAPASSGYHGPGFFPLELKKEKVEEEDHHLGGQHYHHQQQPQQYQTRSALGSSEELGSYISGGFEDLHGEMTDFLMWEESGRGPRHGLLPPAPAHAFSHNSNAAGHYPHHHHHHHQQQHCQASSFPPSISSPLSAPSSSSSFSYTTPLDYDYVPTSGSSFSV